MKSTKTLDRWRSFADGWISPIQAIKERLRGYRQQLDSAHPAWKAKYESALGEYARHDARRELFVTFQTILTNVQLTYVFIRDSLTNLDWWDRNLGTYSDSVADQNIREYGLMAKWFMLHAAVMASEETVRSIVGSAPPGVYSISGQAVSSQPFARLYKTVLSAASLSDKEQFFEFICDTRNTIHTNGFFSPKNGKSKSHDYRGNSLTFQVGRPVDWLTDSLGFQMAADLGDHMFEVVSTSPAAEIGYCPRSAGLSISQDD